MKSYSDSVAVMKVYHKEVCYNFIFYLLLIRHSFKLQQKELRNRYNAKYQLIKQKLDEIKQKVIEKEQESQAQNQAQSDVAQLFHEIVDEIQKEEEEHQVSMTQRQSDEESIDGETNYDEGFDDLEEIKVVDEAAIAKEKKKKQRKVYTLNSDEELNAKDSPKKKQNVTKYQTENEKKRKEGIIKKRDASNRDRDEDSRQENARTRRNRSRTVDSEDEVKNARAPIKVKPIENDDSEDNRKGRSRDKRGAGRGIVKAQRDDHKKKRRENSSSNSRNRSKDIVDENAIPLGRIKKVNRDKYERDDFDNSPKHLKEKKEIRDYGSTRRSESATKNKIRPVDSRVERNEPAKEKRRKAQRKRSTDSEFEENDRVMF